jgi:hypothetical protein
MVGPNYLVCFRLRQAAYELEPIHGHFGFPLVAFQNLL